MDSTGQLFHERIEDAIDEVIRGAGGRKKVAVELWPDKPAREAHNLLDACLNPERRERFAPSQVLWFAQRGRQIGCHAVIMFMARECGYSDPTPIEPQDELAQAQREFSNSVRTLEKLSSKIERLTSLPIRSVA